MSTRKSKTQIPAELRVFLAVVGEIVQEHLQSRQEQSAKITGDGHDKEVDHANGREDAGSDVCEG